MVNVIRVTDTVIQVQQVADRCDHICYQNMFRRKFVLSQLQSILNRSLIFIFLQNLHQNRIIYFFRDLQIGNIKIDVVFQCNELAADYLRDSRFIHWALHHNEFHAGILDLHCQIFIDLLSLFCQNFTGVWIVDIRDITQENLREQIGYVPQKGVLFSGSIASNLQYGKEDASYDEMVEAAETAQAMEFIQTKENGLDEEVSQGGTNVSGGQKQRLSIARALVKKARVYLFDDSFSALDFKTDQVLRKALKEKVGDSTIIIVAQRINTVLDADQIIVMDEGHMAGIGTHEELMRSCEVYKEIALSQLSEEELERGRN